MTLLDAPKYDLALPTGDRPCCMSARALLIALFIGFWFVAGRPVDFPWNWYTHLRGRSTINTFLTDVEKNDLSAAYSLWIHDPEWQKHPQQNGAYDFNRFQQDWSPNSNEKRVWRYPQPRETAAARISGNVLLVGILINGLKSKALFLNYDPRTKQLGFSPAELYLGPVEGGGLWTRHRRCFAGIRCVGARFHRGMLAIYLP